MRRIFSGKEHDKIKPQFIYEFDFASLSKHEVRKLQRDVTFKVLKLTNCPSVAEIWQKLTDDSYKEIFEKSSHLFFIAIETNESKLDGNFTGFHAVNTLKRPFIIQQTSASKKSTILYKKEDASEFIFIPKRNVSSIDYNRKDDCNMALLVQALRSGAFGKFDRKFNLLNVKLSEERSKFTNYFAENSALCHSFLRLFDGRLNEEICLDRAIASLKFDGVESLLVLLDLPFNIEDDEKLELTDDQQDIINLVDGREYNLMMVAAEWNNIYAVKFLLRFGIDLCYWGGNVGTVSDISLDFEHFDVLVLLIEADSPFPTKFDPNEIDAASEAHAKISQMIQKTKSFHESIEQGNVNGVEEYLARNPKVRHSFDIDNKSALTVALESKEFELYSLLLSKGFSPGLDPDFEEVLNKFEDKVTIRDTHKKYFKKGFNAPHLRRLQPKCRVGFGSKNRENCSRRIQEILEELNIPEIVPILQIVSSSEHLKIVFDFDCHSVKKVDPTNDSSTLGITYAIDGYIYVGAQNPNLYEVVGNLAHELSHYAMQLTYLNSCKPYGEGDEIKKNLFIAVAQSMEKLCEDDRSTDPIISRVFEYDEELRHQELIVRVPHLLARYKKSRDILNGIKANTEALKLFNFFTDQTLSDVKTRCNVLLHQLKVQKINRQSGTIEKIKKLNIQFEHPESIEASIDQLSTSLISSWLCYNRSLTAICR